MCAESNFRALFISNNSDRSVGVHHSSVLLPTTTHHYSHSTLNTARPEQGRAIVTSNTSFQSTLGPDSLPESCDITDSHSNRLPVYRLIRKSSTILAGINMVSHCVPKQSDSWLITRQPITQKLQHRRHVIQPSSRAITDLSHISGNSPSPKTTRADRETITDAHPSLRQINNPISLGRSQIVWHLPPILLSASRNCHR